MVIRIEIVPLGEESLFVPAPVYGERVEQRGDQHGGGQVGAQPVPLEAAGRRDGGAVEARAALQRRIQGDSGGLRAGLGSLRFALLGQQVRTSLGSFLIPSQPNSASITLYFESADCEVHVHLRASTARSGKSKAQMTARWIKLLYWPP